MNTSVEGGCLCRTVRYKVTGEPLATSLCHCGSCRLATGGPSVAWVILRAEDFAVTAGTPVQFRSSPDVFRTFCGKCGTALTYRSISRTDLVEVTTISLDNPDDFAPDREIWIEDKLSWETLNDALPHYDRSSVGASPIER